MAEISCTNNPMISCAFQWQHGDQAQDSVFVCVVIERHVLTKDGHCPLNKREES